MQEVEEGNKSGTNMSGDLKKKKISSIILVYNIYPSSVCYYKDRIQTLEGP